MANKHYLIFLILAVVLCACVKHDTRPAQTDAVEIASRTEPKGTLGKRAYEANCLSCHGSFEQTKLKDRSVEEIRSAINSVGVMQRLASVLTESDLKELAISLSSDTDLTPPVAPQNLIASVFGPTSIGLSWSASMDNAGGSGIAGYRIRREGKTLQVVPSTQLQFVEVGLTPSTSYTYQVLAFDPAGNESVENLSVQAQTTNLNDNDSTPPSVPTGIKATVQSPSRIKLEWSASQDEEGGSGLKEYRIFRNDSFLVELNPGLTSFVDANLASGADYLYQIVAVDHKGNISVKSQPVTASTTVANGKLIYEATCTQCHHPYANSELRNFSALQITEAMVKIPAMGTALKDLGADEIAAVANVLSDLSDTISPTTPGNFMGTANSHTEIILTWVVSTDAGGSGLKAYKLYRNNILVNGLIGKDKLSYSEKNLTPNTNYSFRLTAVDNRGNESVSTASLTLKTKEVPVIPDTVKPSVPANLKGTATNYDQINLAWDASTDLGGSGMKSYKVFRNGQLIQTVPVEQKTLSDLGLIPLTSYKYKVVAVDGANNESSASTEISVKTLAPDGAKLYFDRGCTKCHGSLAGSDLKPKTDNINDFVVLFKNAVKSENEGGIKEMQGKGINEIELTAIASLLIAGNGDDENSGLIANYEYKQPIGNRSFVASFLLQTFLNPSNPTAEETGFMKIISDSIGNNAVSFGGNCSRYDANCPQTRFTASTYANATESPNFDVARAGYSLNICAQLLESDTVIASTLTRAGLSASAAADKPNVTKAYSLFFPARTPSLNTLNSLVSLHAQAKTKFLTQLKAWRMVLLPLCEWAVAGGI